MEEKKLNSVENVNVVVENSTKEQVNKVSAKKAKAQAKANNILYKDILANLNKSTEGLFKNFFLVLKNQTFTKKKFFQNFRTKRKKLLERNLEIQFFHCPKV